MNRLAPLMSSASGEWQTPPVILDLVRQLGPIELDPCTTRENPTGADAICVQSGPRPGDGSDVVVDGLAADWQVLADGGICYVNPPYGRAIRSWVARCHALGRVGGHCIALLPARPDTAWWHDFCAPPSSDAVCFWRGRLRFVGATSSAPFPSAVVYWGGAKHRFADVFAGVGAIWI